MGIPRINGIALPICGCCCFLFQVLDDDSFVLLSDADRPLIHSLAQ